MLVVSATCSGTKVSGVWGEHEVVAVSRVSVIQAKGEIGGLQKLKQVSDAGYEGSTVTTATFIQLCMAYKLCELWNVCVNIPTNSFLSGLFFRDAPTVEGCL